MVYTLYDLALCQFHKGPLIDNREVKLNIPSTLLEREGGKTILALEIISVFHNCPTKKLKLIFLLVMITTHYWHFLTATW